MSTSFQPRHLRRRQIFGSNSKSILTDRFLVDGDHFAHDHDFMEIAIITGGYGQHCSINGKVYVRDGDAFILRPGTWHTYSECRQLEVYNCCFGVELLQRELAWIQEEPLLHYLFWGGPLGLHRRGLITLHLPIPAMERCRRHLHVLRHLTRSSTGNNTDVSNYLDQIGRLLLLLGELARSMGPEYRAACVRTSHIHPAVVEGMRLLEENLVHPWTLSELAGQLCINSSHLSRLFKSATGLPPLAYLGRCRAERAAQLLLRTTRPIAHIASEVGWCDPTLFARRFRAHFGVSATTYRTRFMDHASE